MNPLLSLLDNDKRFKSPDLFVFAIFLRRASCTAICINQNVGTISHTEAGLFTFLSLSRVSIK